MNNDLAIKQLVKRHFAELHELRRQGRLSEADHNRIGMSLANCLGDLARLSGKGWVLFQRIVDEARSVRNGD